MRRARPTRASCWPPRTWAERHALWRVEAPGAQLHLVERALFGVVEEQLVAAPLVRREEAVDLHRAVEQRHAQLIGVQLQAVGDVADTHQGLAGTANVGRDRPAVGRAWTDG